MHVDRSAALDPQSADAVAEKWLDYCIGRPAERFAFSQMRWLLSDLAQLCIQLSLRLGEGEEQLITRLDAAHHIVSSAWHSIAVGDARRWRRDDGTAEQKAEIEKERHVLWTRRDPRVAFEEGDASPHSTNFIQDELESAVAEYLARPELRLPALDWIFLDVTISRALCAFGEEVKKKWLPGPRDPLLQIHARYLTTGGNLQKMRRGDRSEATERLCLRFVGLGFAPAAGAYVAFHLGYTDFGWLVLGLQGAAALAYMSVLSARALGRRIARAMGRADPRRKPFQTLDEMYEVWLRLEGPVVNPSHVRDAMVRSTELGAVWDNVSWALIDRVISIDAAVWLIPRRAM